MTETTDLIGSRRHSSRLAVASFVCAIVAVTCHFLFVRAERAQTEGLCLVFGLIGFACFLAGPILGVAALDKMPRSKRILSLKKRKPGLRAFSCPFGLCKEGWGQFLLFDKDGQETLHACICNPSYIAAQVAAGRPPVTDKDEWLSFLSSVHNLHLIDEY